METFEKRLLADQWALMKAQEAEFKALQKGASEEEAQEEAEKAFLEAFEECLRASK